MIGQEILKVGGTKFVGSTLLYLGGFSALAVGGVIAWKMWQQDKPESLEQSSTVQECTGDESAKTLHADLQAEIDALHAEKQKLSEQVDELKNQTNKPQTSAQVVPPRVEKKHTDESFPKTNLKLGMLQQLIRENLDLRNATT